jgi:hypothetical protein
MSTSFRKKSRKKGVMMNATMCFKVSKESQDDFNKKAREQYGVKPADMLRELIAAFNEGRITIKPSEGQEKLFSELYDKE